MQAAALEQLRRKVEEKQTDPAGHQHTLGRLRQSPELDPVRIPRTQDPAQSSSPLDWRDATDLGGIPESGPVRLYNSQDILRIPNGQDRRSPEGLGRILESGSARMGSGNDWRNPGHVGRVLNSEPVMLPDWALQQASASLQQSWEQYSYPDGCVSACTVLLLDRRYQA